MRALAGSREAETFRRAAEALRNQPEYFEGLGTAELLRLLAARKSEDPLEALEQSPARTTVAQLLMREGDPVTGEELEPALLTVEQHYVEHRQRAVRSAVAEAERRGELTRVTELITERMELDRRLRELDRRLRELVGQG